MAQTPDSFHDHFSDVAASYLQFRPRYPPALFAFLASLCTARNQAWDCATGNGQAAIGLAEHFERVVATDASENQIAHAMPHARVDYRVAQAVASGLPASSMNLVTVAQAMHWLDAPAFFAEANRVLARDGVAAVWAYGRMQFDDPGIRQVFDRFNDDTVGPYWPEQRSLVDEGYASLYFPFAEIASPAFAMEAAMSAVALAGFAGTWSATRRFRELRGSDPVPELLRELQRVWPADRTRERARWPISLRVGRKRGAGVP